MKNERAVSIEVITQDEISPQFEQDLFEVLVDIIFDLEQKNDFMC